MPDDQKYFKAHLIRYRDPDSEDYIWFWIHPSTGRKISGDFLNQEDAEIWFKEVMEIHTQTNDLIARTRYGKFFKLKAVLDEPYILKPNCPFYFTVEDGNLLSIRILALDIKEAQARTREHFKVKEWIKGNPKKKPEEKKND